jgi:8-oxo-dGTP pyrophosphatase MutT (NUDIX family)
MDFDIPREVVFPVEHVDVALDPAPHPFETRHRPEIEANWQAEVAANPALFDGQMALLSRLDYRDGRLGGSCHAIRYATFLYWRRVRPRPDVRHAFAHAMPVTSDGALIAARMGRKTANPGRVYFAAGSFEMADFTDGRVDVERNMMREVAEEIGLDLARLDRDPHYHAWSSDAGTVIFRRYRVPMAADETDRAIRAFIAAETDPEIEEPVIIRSPADLPDGISPHMRPLIGWHFDGEAFP